MSLQSIEQVLQGCPTIAEKEAWVRANVCSTRPAKVSRDDFARLKELIRKNHRQDAAALLLAMAVCASGNSLMADLRRQGLLRASRYDFRIGALREMVRILDRLHDALGLEPRWRDYLASVDALHYLAADAKRLRHALLARLSKRRGRALKTFLVIANQAFAARTRVPIDAEIDESSIAHALDGLSTEDIASMVSRVLTIAREAGGLHMTDFSYTDERALKADRASYLEDLHTAFRLDELCRAETLIDGLPYCARTLDNLVLVSSIDPDLEKSVRLGYVQMEMQMLIRQVGIEEVWAKSPSPMSLTKLFEEIYAPIISQFMQIKDKPVRRITFGIPDMPGLFDPLAEERAFREDFLALLQLDVDDYEDLELEPFEVAPGVRSTDLFRISRLFALVEFLYQHQLTSITDSAERERLALHSIIAVFRHEQLLAFLSTVLPVETAEKVISLLVLDDSREFVDLQYTPFLKVDGYYLLAPSVIAHANLVRNIAFANGLNEKRLAGEADPMQSAVEQALRDAGFHVGVEVKGNRKAGDTDLVAYRDGTLYLIECKNAYHPCNAHEMRNSYDHIRKAGEQLTLREQMFADPAYQTKVWKVLGWNVAAPTATRTLVLTANRVFTGSTIQGHPVRQAHEFINVIARGKINSLGTIFRFWEGDSLSTADVNRYLGRHGLAGEQFAALDPINYTNDFGARTLVFESWRFSVEKHHELLQTRYADRAEAVVF
ncbi:hypothetical protein [Xanthomonas tesorieronis]|uniref:hypothetical protein n=1 Tax=Xanthomonas tesorieronis TaxID=3160839 RepID=UPI0035123487